MYHERILNYLTPKWMYILAAARVLLAHSIVIQIGGSKNKYGGRQSDMKSLTSDLTEEIGERCEGTAARRQGRAAFRSRAERRGEVETSTGEALNRVKAPASAQPSPPRRAARREVAATLLFPCLQFFFVSSRRHLVRDAREQQHLLCEREHRHTVFGAPDLVRCNLAQESGGHGAPQHRRDHATLRVAQATPDFAVRQR